MANFSSNALYGGTVAIDREALNAEHDPILQDRLARLADTEFTLADGHVYRPPTMEEAQSILERMTELAADHITACRFKSVVVPASGGADSTFMLAILRRASDRVYAREVLRQTVRQRQDRPCGDKGRDTLQLINGWGERWGAHNMLVRLWK